jgi:hypothetical protein
VSTDPDDTTSQRKIRVAHFPLELLLITVLYAIAYGREALGCSSESSAPQGTPTASTATTAK